MVSHNFPFGKQLTMAGLRSAHQSRPRTSLPTPCSYSPPPPSPVAIIPSRHFSSSPSSPLAVPTAHAAAPPAFDFQPFRRTDPSLIPLSTGDPIEPSGLPKLACQRRSPLLCPNEALLDELSVLCEYRRIRCAPGTSEDQNELAYQRAMSAIKAYPTQLRSEKEALQLPFVGKKIATLIGEFIKTRQIALAQDLRNDERLRTCLLFQTLQTIGPLKARDLYDDSDCRTLEDIYKLYPDKRLEIAHWEELQSRVPRAEAEKIARLVHEEIQTVFPGCRFTICGSYRRGKRTCADVDLVFTHPWDSNAMSLESLTAVVHRLKQKGIVQAVLSGSALSTSKRTSKVYTKYVVLRLPEDNGLEKQRRRRIDIIFAPYELYLTAVVGWTGSKSFARDLRLHAQKQALKFDSSGIVEKGGRLLAVDPRKGEEGVFEALGLEYVRPQDRCADP